MENPLKGLGIAITRPIAQATKLNSLIRDNGGESISFPLIDIVPLEDYSVFDSTIQALKTYDWAIFISSNAVQNGMPRVLSQFNELPSQLEFAAIGPVTACELMQMSTPNALISRVLIPKGRFDSESLLSLAEMQNMQGKRVMIFRGIGGREVLADTLKTRGAEVTFAECYQRINPQIDCSQLEQLWRNKQLHAIVVTSSEAMRYLLEMTHNGSDDWLCNIQICVNHARIAEEAPNHSLKITVADAPGDDAMLTCLQRALFKSVVQK